MATALLICACGSPAGDAEVHNHSFARPDEVVMDHLELDIIVDFDSRRIHGVASIRIRNPKHGDKLYLDTRDLLIHRVTLDDSDEDAAFRLGREVEPIGRPLIIDIEPRTTVVHVFYETTEGATALGWLKASQTADRRHPFLYTQGEAILTRTWIPCQDNPGIRFTYNARIEVPRGTLAVMSAENGTAKDPSGVYEFNMPQPVPAYLIALAVGDLEFRPLSDRCGVYAEPGVVDKAAWEFADTESMVRAAEKLYGPYRWDRFDILVLPPSFPYGGMENPRLTFVTPVLVAGDRSLVSTIAHELAHSWSGNLVTNATWDDFWLNEGFTTYFERRILEALYGRPYAEMEALLGFRNLQEDFEDLGPNNADTRLKLDLTGRDPDEGATFVPYEKGYLLLRLIEEAVGRAKFDDFLRRYFDTFEFQTMTSERFLAYLRAELLDDATFDRLQIRRWVYEPGLPDNYPRAQSHAFTDVEAQVAAWRNGTPADRLATKGWASQQWKHFVQNLPSPMTVEQMRELDAAFDFTHRANAEIRQQWFLHAIANHYEEAYAELEDYLVTIGRIWLITPLYRKLVETPEGREQALDIYRRARPGYHGLTVAAVDPIVGWGS